MTSNRIELRVVESLHDYARVVARIRRVGSLDRALEEAGVTPEEFQRAQTWQRRISEGLEGGDATLANVFATAFRTEMSAPADEPADGDDSASSAPPSLRSALGASNAAAARPFVTDRASDTDVERAVVHAEDLRVTREVAFPVFGAALPFDPTAPGTLPESEPRSRPVPNEADPLEQTVSVEVLLPPELVLPFAPAPTMSVEQYASLCASLEVFPDKREVILARYGIGDETHLTTVREAFASLLKNDPRTGDAFALRFAEVRNRLLGVSG